MIEWKDTSSYDQRDKERVPSSFTATIGGVRLSVHRHIYHDPEHWLATSHPRILHHELLASKVIEDAQCQAVAKLQVACQDVIDAIIEK